MDPNLPPNLIPVLLAVAAMVVVATLVLRGIGTGMKREPIVTIIRAAIQLGILALILRVVFSSMWLVVGWLLVMLTVAIITSTRRIGWSKEILLTAAAAITLSSVLTIGLVVASGAIQSGTQYVLAFGGIVIGNMMSITSLTARRLREHYRDSRDEIAGWLALGAPPRKAAARFRGLSVHHAIFPTVDSTKTTGLVTLPGAFVGAIFGGSDPVEAGLFQLIVLSGIMFGGAIAASTVVWILGAPTVLPNPREDEEKAKRSERHSEGRADEPDEDDEPEQDAPDSEASDDDHARAEAELEARSSAPSGTSGDRDARSSSN